MQTITAYIGLGSNMPSTAGPPHATLHAAMGRLGSLGEVTARSSLYETDPVGYTTQPRFVNAAVMLRTSLSPLELLDHLLAIERELGRERANMPSKGPRTLDLDLLMVEGFVLNEPRLVLPHPEMAKRRFVLAPLAEIAPDAVHPVLGKTMDALLAKLPDRGENRIAAVNISSTAR